MKRAFVLPKKAPTEEEKRTHVRFRANMTLIRKRVKIYLHVVSKLKICILRS